MKTILMLRMYGTASNVRYLQTNVTPVTINCRTAVTVMRTMNCSRRDADNALNCMW